MAATLLLALAAPWFRTARWLLAAAFGAYFLLVLSTTLLTVFRTRRPSDLALLAVIPLMHLSYGLGQWTELFRPGRDFSESLPGK